MENKKKKVPNAESYAVKKKFLKMVIRRIKKFETMENVDKVLEETNHKEWFKDILKYKQQYVSNKFGDITDILKSL